MTAQRGQRVPQRFVRRLPLLDLPVLQGLAKIRRSNFGDSSEDASPRAPEAAPSPLNKSPTIGSDADSGLA